MTRPFEVIPYNPEWAQRFAEEARHVKQALGKVCLAIHHIGSTSIPGMPAKPILDMLLEVPDILAMDEAISALEALEYLAREVSLEEMRHPLYRYFSKGTPRSHQLHVWQTQSPEIQNLLFFRDYLIQHKDIADHYAGLKQELASRYAHDRRLYTAGKASFIQTVLKKRV